MSNYKIGSTYTSSGSLNPRAFSTISDPNTGRRLTWGQTESMFPSFGTTSPTTGSAFSETTSNIRAGLAGSAFGDPNDRTGRLVERALGRADRVLGTGGAASGGVRTDAFGKPLDQNNGSPFQYAKDTNVYGRPFGTQITGNYGNRPLEGTRVATNWRY
jgi:hypothetical protein